MDTAAAIDFTASGHAVADAELCRALAEEEWLASRVLQHVADAREVCRLALVNRNFLSASLTDTVWRDRLPPKALLDAVGAPALGQRDLYLHLCKSIFYEEGRKKFWLDTASGGECYMISARTLRIIWGDDTRYWRWQPSTGSMFPEVAFLNSVCWFDLVGTFQQCLRPGKYMLSFRMQFNAAESSWADMPVTLSVQTMTYGYRQNLSQVFFKSTTFKRRRCPSADMTSLSQTAGFQIGGTSEPAEDIANTDSEANNEPLSSDESVPYDSDECPEVDDDTVKQKDCIDADQSFQIGGTSEAAEDVANIDSEANDDSTSADESVPYGSDECPEEDDDTVKPVYQWVECDAGEFLVEDDNDGQPIEVQFSMKEVDVLYWKTGFVLDGVIIRPYDIAAKVIIE